MEVGGRRKEGGGRRKGSWEGWGEKRDPCHLLLLLYCLTWLIICTLSGRSWACSGMSPASSERKRVKNYETGEISQEGRMEKKRAGKKEAGSEGRTSRGIVTGRNGSKEKGRRRRSTEP